MESTPPQNLPTSSETDASQGSSTSFQSMAEDVRQLKTTVASLVQEVQSLLPRFAKQANVQTAEPKTAALQPVKNLKPGAENKPLQSRQGENMKVIYKGYCTRYNSKFARCNGKPCKFRHLCPICDQRHPLFKCKSK